MLTSEQWLKDFREVSMLIWKDVLKKEESNLLFLEILL